MPRWVDGPTATKLLNSPLEYLLLDIDGVVFSGTKVLPRIPETLKYLQFKGKKIRFVSNNSSLSRRQILETFEDRGIRGFRQEEVYNSAYAAAQRLQQLLGRPTVLAETTQPPAPVAVAGRKERPELGSSARTARGQSEERHLTNPPSPFPPAPPKQHLLVHGNLFVIGEEGLHEELRQVLAPGYISYGLELHDASAAGRFNGARVAAAWAEGVLPPPRQPLVIRPPRTGAGRRQPSATPPFLGPAAQAGGRAETLVQAGTPTARSISLRELDAVAVVVGLDFHFSTLKLACAGMILRGPPRDPAASRESVWRAGGNVVADEYGARRGSLTVGGGGDPVRDSNGTLSSCSGGNARGGGGAAAAGAGAASVGLSSADEEGKPAGALFIGTNVDPQVPIGPPGVFGPGDGCFVHAVAIMAGREPDVLCGKPQLDMAAVLFASEGILNPAVSCLMVGDRLTTDIAFGRAAGCQTMLVLSGAEAMSDVQEATDHGREDHIPDYVAHSLACFIP